jgi:hypothetical protein
MSTSTKGYSSKLKAEKQETFGILLDEAIKDIIKKFGGDENFIRASNNCSVT